MSKSFKKHKLWFDEADFETDADYEKRKAKEARKKKADADLLELMMKEGFGG